MGNREQGQNQIASCSELVEGKREKRRDCGVAEVDHFRCPIGQHHADAESGNDCASAKAKNQIGKR